MKILKEKRVRSYEFTFLVPASLTSVDIAAANTAVLALIKKHGLTIKDQVELNGVQKLPNASEERTALA